MKKVLILLIVLVITFSFSISYVNDTIAIESVITSGDQFWTPIGAPPKAKKILGTIQWIGYAIAIGMLIVIGIKYVIAASDEKANLKGALVKYVIGAVLIAGASAIAYVIWLI